MAAHHNGDLGLAMELARKAHAAGADLVKFQFRTPVLCIPEAQKVILKETPWGSMSYLEYRERLEFQSWQWDDLAAELHRLGIPWFASPWDLPSLTRLMRYDPPCLKVPSACLTDLDLLHAMRQTGKPVIASTGMSNFPQIQRAVAALGPDRLILLHCRSTYPCPPEDLNLQAIVSLRERFAVPTGYSGHEVGLWTSLCAVVLGASVLERHFTDDRSRFGSDQAASVEPHGFADLVKQIRGWEEARGDGRLGEILDSERPVMARLRRVL